jgi:hypothetical protein
MRGPFLTGGAGVLSLIAFFVMPQNSSLGGMAFITGSQLASVGQGQDLACVLWLIPVVAGAGVLVSAGSLLTHKNYREGAELLIAGGIIGAMMLVGEILFIEFAGGGFQNVAGVFAFALSFFGSGFWLTFLGMLGLAVGGYYLHADA